MHGASSVSITPCCWIRSRSRPCAWCSAGKIGQVQSVECHRSQDVPPYLSGPLPPYYRDGGHPFRDLGIHAFYQVEAFLGEILDVQWWMAHQGRDPNLPFDEWRAWLRCRQGSAQVYLSWNVRPLQDLLLIHGSLGVIRLDRFGMTVTTKRQRRLPEHPQRAWNALGDAAATAWQVPWGLARVVTHRLRRYHGLQAMVHDFYESLSQGKAASGTSRRCAPYRPVAGTGGIRCRSPPRAVSRTIRRIPLGAHAGDRRQRIDRTSPAAPAAR